MLPLYALWSCYVLKFLLYLTGLSPLLTRKLRSQLKIAKDNMTTLMKELITFVDTHYPPTTFGVRKVMDIIAIAEKTGESSYVVFFVFFYSKMTVILKMRAKLLLHH